MGGGDVYILRFTYVYEYKYYYILYIYILRGEKCIRVIDICIHARYDRARECSRGASVRYTYIDLLLHVRMKEIERLSV